MEEVVHGVQQRIRAIMASVLGPIACLVSGAVVGALYAVIVTLNSFNFLGLLLCCLAGMGLAIGAKTIVRYLGGSDQITTSVCSVLAVIAFVWVYATFWLQLNQYDPWSANSMTENLGMGLFTPLAFIFQEVVAEWEYFISVLWVFDLNFGSRGTSVIWVVELVILCAPGLLLGPIWDGVFYNPLTGGRLEPVGKPIIIAPVPDSVSLQEQLKARDFSGLVALPAVVQHKLASGEGSKHDRLNAAEATFLQDLSDPESFALTVFSGDMSHNGHGHWNNLMITPEIDHLILSASEYRELRDRLGA